MTEEEAITTITFGQNYLNAEEVIREINRCILHNERTDLRLVITYGSKFIETLEMRNFFLEIIIHIKRFHITNYCRKRNEYLSWFHFFVELLQQEANNNHNNGETVARKHFGFENLAGEGGLSLECTNQLVNALRSNSNGNNIEKFNFHDCLDSRKVFQPLWDTLLESGVQDLWLNLQFLDNEDDDNTNNSNHNENDNTFNFIGLSTNTSLERLHLIVRHMLQQDRLNMFHSIKVNKVLKKVSLSFDNNVFDDDREIAAFREMLSENSTLFDLKIYIYNRFTFVFQDEIEIHMKFNSMWNRYIMKRKEEATATATATVNGITTTIPAIASTVDANNKKKFKMRLFLSLFMNKPVLRDTIIFHLLREYPGDLGLLNNNDDSQQQQNQMLLLLRTTTTVVSSCAAKNKKKRPYEE